MSRGDHNTPTEPKRARPNDLHGRIELLEREQQRQREAQDKLGEKYDAILRGLGTLTTRINTAIAEIEARGWTRWPVRLVTAAALLIAIAEVGARAGLW